MKKLISKLLDFISPNNFVGYSNCTFLKRDAGSPPLRPFKVGEQLLVSFKEIPVISEVAHEMNKVYSTPVIVYGITDKEVNDYSVLIVMSDLGYLYLADWKLVEELNLHMFYITKDLDIRVMQAVKER